MSEGNFEAVKVSYRQTKDGMVVAFAIHPNDAPGELATLKLGTRLMLAWAAINDDETTNSVGGSPPGSAAPSDTAVAGTVHPAPAPAEQKPKRERTPAERAGFLCTLPEFRQWIWEIDYGSIDRDSVGDAAEWVRRRCGVKSRSHITNDPSAHEAFKRIEDAFHRRNDPPPHTEPR